MEIEIVADMQESREIEDRREPLQAEFILNTFRAARTGTSENTLIN